MTQTVKGIYRNGKVELLELPSDISEGEVMVTFVRSQESPAEKSQMKGDRSQMMYFGVFSNGEEQFTEADFKAAEFHGDDDDGLDWTQLLKYVVDTHVLLWFVSGSSQLSRKAKAVLDSAESKLVVPAIAFAESVWIVRKSKNSAVSV